MAPASLEEDSLGHRPVDRRELFEGICKVLDLYTRESGTSRGVPPMILFLDDLQWADEATLDVLDYVLGCMDRSRIWVIVAIRSAAGRGHLQLIERLSEVAGEDRFECIELRRLGTHDMVECASSLVGVESGGRLAEFLDRFSGRLPQTLAELINGLWDERILESAGDTEWRLRELPEDPGAGPEEGPGPLINRRLAQLPSSVRRLLTVAAVIGPRFETGLLTAAASEHSAVVEIAIEVALERWLLRGSLPFWSSPGREMDLVLWSRGARRGSFEFAHETIRHAIFESLESRRRREIHGLVATALERRYQRNPDRVREELAFHWSEAREPGKAAHHLYHAAIVAHDLGADSNALDYAQRALREMRRPREAISRSGDESESQVTLQAMQTLLISLGSSAGVHRSSG